eukprot:8335878-Pyramimonas_sp.AAC.1
MWRHRIFLNRCAAEVGFGYRRAPNEVRSLPPPPIEFPEPLIDGRAQIPPPTHVAVKKRFGTRAWSWGQRGVED